MTIQDIIKQCVVVYKPDSQYYMKVVLCVKRHWRQYFFVNEHRIQSLYVDIS